MKRILWIVILSLCLCMAACSSEGQEQGSEDGTTVHQHVPDGANCQQPQYCAECGELLAESGPHAYPDQPNAQQDGFAYYVCEVCGMIKVVNTGGLPVVPVE